MGELGHPDDDEGAQGGAGEQGQGGGERDQPPAEDGAAAARVDGQGEDQGPARASSHTRVWAQLASMARATRASANSST